MDKTGTMYILKSFKVNLQLIPNFQVLGVAVRDMQSKLSKPIAEIIKSEPLKGALEAFKTNNKFEDATHAFGLWVDKALEAIKDLPEDKFIGQRGRDTSNTKVTLFGQLITVPEHVAKLVEGSKLSQILAQGPKSLDPNFMDSSWKDLHMVFNSLKTSLTNAIPETAKTKRQTREQKEAEANTAEATANANAEVTSTVEGSPAEAVTA